MAAEFVWRYYLAMKISVIVNADDLGRTPEINDGIEAAHRGGIVSSTSIVAGSRAFAHGIEVAKRNPTLDVGIHLSANEYPPLVSHPFLRSLAGKGLRDAFARIAIATPSEIDLIEGEFDAQIRRVLQAGVTPTHIDGHNHVHVHPRLVGVVARLAQRYSLPMTRLPWERFGHGGRKIEKLMLNPSCAAAAAIFRFRGLAFPAEFHGFSEGGRLSAARLSRLCINLRPGVNEIMCHVGTINDDPPYHIGYSWADERAALMSITPSELLSRFGARLVRRREALQ